MGNVVKIGTGEKRPVSVPVDAPRDVLGFSRLHLGELIELTGRALSPKRGEFGFNERFMPVLNFGYVKNPQRVNYIGLMISKSFKEVNVAVSEKYALPKIPPGQMLDKYGQIGAEALFMVAYGLATYASRRISHANSRGFDAALWQRTDMPHAQGVMSMRAAGAVVAAHFEFVGAAVDSLKRELSQESVVPSHAASLVNPLDMTQARELFTRLTMTT